MTCGPIVLRSDPSLLCCPASTPMFLQAMQLTAPYLIAHRHVELWMPRCGSVKPVQVPSVNQPRDCQVWFSTCRLLPCPHLARLDSPECSCEEACGWEAVLGYRRRTSAAAVRVGASAFDLKNRRGKATTCFYLQLHAACATP